MIAEDAFLAIKPLFAALEILGVDYLIGGSLASAVWGVPRSTLDVDLVTNLGDSQTGAFVRLLGNAYYADEEAIRRAVRQQASFNIIHLETMFKVDVFLLKDTPYAQMEFAPRRLIDLGIEPERKAYFSSPEDTVLSKLKWYKLGGGISDRQWYDIVGILKVQTNKLDCRYMDLWARKLGLSDFLSQAWDEAGGDIDGSDNSKAPSG